ncbi:hypothetical protein BX600DRAFT_436220 [Xylariales sp. PMI_506]|nr:hypothetical protein BX600DRAFT_436220 [Xylariales sp. PMI_506]
MGAHQGHMYQNVPAEDIQGSSAEFDEAIELGDADYAVSGRHSKRCGGLKSFAAYRWLLDIFLLLVILGLLLERWQASQQKGNAYEVAGDVIGFHPQFSVTKPDADHCLPIVSQRIITFQPDPGYAPEEASDFFSSQVRQNWLDLLPAALGFIKIDNPEQYEGLPTPLRMFEEQGMFVVETTVTHQLHCLYAIMESHAWLTLNRTGHEAQKPWHVAHCFDYLRQSILCYGDVTLEGQQTTFKDGQDGSDGWDGKHVCRDYSQIREHLTEYAVDNRTWI